MSQTVNDAVVQARKILQDEMEPYRYPTSDLLTYLNNSMYELKRIRPDAWINTLNTDLPMYSDNATDLATDLPFNGIFFQPTVMYMAGYAELRDDEYTQDSRAAILMQSFITSLTRGIGT
jgi:hypothetical protein